MEKMTGYSEQDLKEPVDEIKSFALEINPKFISTLKYKFSKPEYLQVAKHQFKFWICMFHNYHLNVNVEVYYNKNAFDLFL